MSTKSFFATLAVAALVTPAFAAEKQVAANSAEIKALGHLAWVARADDPKPAPPACCDKKRRIAARTATTPVELKATGHLAWVARSNDPVPAPGCVKRVPAAKVAYDSPAEVKAFGHLAARAAAEPKVITGAKAACCATPRCPMMRSAS